MNHSSSTKTVPSTGLMPKHIAIIMDGNGRWATKRFLPRVAGHVKGVDAVRGIVEACIKRDIQFLTLFAFSSENWRRPADEVSLLMRLFVTALEKEVKKMHDNNIRLKIVGDLSRFDLSLQEAIHQAEQLTTANTRLTVTVCANYGGRWDILQAMNKVVANGQLAGEITEEMLEAQLSMAYAPEPDLFIRTGGETRISNFLLWQLAYTELFFTETFWPDFNAQSLDEAIASYQSRERRFGRTSAQVTDVQV
ncbi:polyprenyl diphosphate synthase [Undibacterium macrobrachii]|jgi:undecaprenyl diphosphate synthase|uniref:Isoprenyl transferase n=1 Tax=Undibacterium macrobrachii TaxID=1119058 RepID=A0ABQ2X5M2_9BURK|nr:polyprenyl diphosphate synthase [Undibacterium macrobrachii]GGX00493.1 isoprenyl transferase [Undibacterium macrobrachii]